MGGQGEQFAVAKKPLALSSRNVSDARISFYLLMSQEQEHLTEYAALDASQDSHET